MSLPLTNPRFRLFVALCLCCLSAQASAATPPGADVLASLDLEVAWTGQAVLDPSRDRIRHITNDEEQIYVQSSLGTITAFNAETGRRMWARQVGRNDDHSMRAVSNSELLVVLSGPVAWGLDKFTGDDLFRFRLRRLPTAAPAIQEGSVYFPLGDGSVYGYALQTLVYLDRYNTLPPGVARPHLWRFASNERVEQSPVATEDVVAFTSTSNNLHSLSAAGSSYFQEYLNAPASAPMALELRGERRNIIMATEAGNLFSFDLTRGTLTWQVPLERRVLDKPLVVEDQVFVVTEGMGATGVSLVHGNYVQVENEIGTTDRWYVPGILSLIGVAGEHVYGVDQNERVVAIDRRTAVVRGRTGVGGYAIHHQNSLTDRLYLCSNAGELLCLKQRGSDFAQYHQHPEKRPLNVDVPLNDAELQQDDAEADDAAPRPE